MSRKMEKRIDIAADREAVWKALTDPVELTRWFPLAARVEPGAGGTVFYSWGSRWEGASAIEVWDPEVCLRMVAAPPEGEETTGSGQKAWLADEAGVRLVVDFKLEATGGTTTLRLVHSGFGDGTSWDDEYDSVSRGWDYELRSLRHYLETHRGKDRSVAWVRWRLGMPPAEAWPRLIGAGGLTQVGFPEGLRTGAPYRLEMPAGQILEGTVLIWDPPVQFAGTVRNMGESLARVELDTYGGSSEASLWLASWRSPAAELASLKEGWTKTMTRLFPAGPAPGV